MVPTKTVMIISSVLTNFRHALMDAQHDGLQKVSFFPNLFWVSCGKTNQGDYPLVVVGQPRMPVETKSRVADTAFCWCFHWEINPENIHLRMSYGFSKF